MQEKLSQAGDMEEIMRSIEAKARKNSQAKMEKKKAQIEAKIKEESEYVEFKKKAIEDATQRAVTYGESLRSSDPKIDEPKNTGMSEFQ